MKKIYAIISCCVVCCGIIAYLCSNKNVRYKTRDKIISVNTGIAKASDVCNSVAAIGTANSNESVEIKASVTKKVVDISFSDGQYVRKGDLLIQLDAAQELAEEKKLALNYAEQEREFNRLESLHKNKVVSNKEYESQRTKMLSAKAELELIRAKIKETQIFAPFDGLLGMRDVSVGSLVSPSTTVTTIDDIKKIKVDFYVPEKYVLNIKKGGTIIATSEANPDKTFHGTIVAVAPRIDKTSHNALVRSTFNNDELLLRPGMLLKLKIIINNKRSICVPDTAIVNSGDKQYIFVIIKGRAAKRQIQSGMRINNQIEILDGICENEKYICDGLLSIKDGSIVNTQNIE